SSIIQNAPLFTPTPVGGPRSPTPTVGSQGQLGGIPATPTLGPADFTATAVAGQTATAAALSETATAEPTPSPSATASPTPSPTATPTANATEQAQSATPTPLPLIPVPDVVGQSFASAAQLLAEDGLTVARGADQASAVAPAGNVITQVPVSGSLIPPGSQVLLIISSGPPGITVPKVQGLSVDAAEATLQNAGLSFSTKQQPSSSVPQGTVISQSPAAGTQVQPSQTVQITVSAGNLIAVPNVVGMAEQQAQDTIKAAGLATTFANHSGHSPSVQVGQVESETPPAGKLVPPGTTVYINVRVS
ncbi:MAG: PASTA domain-containing protein, partial [Chloroflexi bacterium]|nr:PASTA domain-containing protein [Chloroflexota bacterium]